MSQEICPDCVDRINFCDFCMIKKEDIKLNGTPSEILVVDLKEHV